MTLYIFIDPAREHLLNAFNGTAENARAFAKHCRANKNPYILVIVNHDQVTINEKEETL